MGSFGWWIVAQGCTGGNALRASLVGFAFEDVFHRFDGVFSVDAS